MSSVKNGKNDEKKTWKMADDFGTDERGENKNDLKIQRKAESRSLG